MDAEEKIAYHTLATILRGDYRALKKLREDNGTWKHSLRIFKKTKKDIDPEVLWQSLVSSGVELVLDTDAEFPTLLKEIPWPPLAIYLRGAPLVDMPRIAIVGTRKAGTYGKSMARKFAEVFAEHSLCVVSGLALGIDAEAHEGALKAKGRTIGVIGCGIDRIYPKEHERLAEQILASKGTILSEYPPGSPALPHRFIERNRIISGLSKATVVVEAPEDSGALATARFAVEQNRDVFVVPGPIDNSHFLGSHQLIKDGASLAISGEDVIHTMGFDAVAPLPLEDNEELDTDQKAIINMLEREQPLSIDEIAEMLSREIAEVARKMSFLTIEGKVKEEGGKFSRT